MYCEACENDQHAICFHRHCDCPCVPANVHMDMAIWGPDEQQYPDVPEVEG